VSEQIIYVFECEDGEHFALTHDLDSLRREVRGFGKSDWNLRSRLLASDKRAGYFEAEQMLKNRLVCFLRREPDGGLECVCDESCNTPSSHQGRLH
jgi:hypothetical protein